MDRPRNDDEAFRRRVAESVESESESESSDDGPETYTVREGVTRAIDPEDYSTIRSEQELTQESTHSRAESVGGFNPDAELARPPGLPESVQVTDVAPDGTSIGGSGLTSPTGEAIGGSGLSDAIQGRANELGGDALGRGIDFDPSSPGTNESGPGGSSGDADLDRMLMEHDGSMMSAPKLKDFDAPAPTPPKDDGNVLTDMWKATKEFLGVETKETGDPVRETGPRQKQTVDPKPPEDDYTENPMDDGVDSATNLERVTVMQGSQVQPSNNPNDGGDTGSTENFIPPQDLVTRPTEEGESTDTTLTSAATLGSSPVTNPTDPVLGDEGRMEGSYAGGGGGGEVMPTSMTAGDASALGGQGEANLPITLEPAPAPAGDASALGGQGEANLPITLEPAPAPAGMDAIAGKEDVNGVSVDMVTGQVIGSAAPAVGGELDGATGAVSQGDEGDDEEGVQSLGGAPSTAFAAAAPTSAGLATGGMVSQGDEGDADDGGVPSFAGGDAAMAAMADPAATVDVGDALPSADVFGAPDVGAPPMGEDSDPLAPPGSEG